MTEEKKVVEKKKNPTEEFIERRMKAVNEMSSPANAKKAAIRILQNRRKVGK